MDSGYWYCVKHKLCCNFYKKPGVWPDLSKSRTVLTFDVQNGRCVQMFKDRSSGARHGSHSGYPCSQSDHPDKHSTGTKKLNLPHVYVHGKGNKVDKKPEGQGGLHLRFKAMDQVPKEPRTEREHLQQHCGPLTQNGATQRSRTRCTPYITVQCINSKSHYRLGFEFRVWVCATRW